MTHTAQQLTITTIKPTLGRYVTIEQRKASADDAEKPNCYVSYTLPELLSSIANEQVLKFCINAYEQFITKHARIALKEGKEIFAMPSIEQLGEAKKREFTFTKALVQVWLDNCAFAVINAAIAAKSQQGINSASVVKKALKYSALFTSMAGGAVMTQADINSCAAALDLVEKATESGTLAQHDFTCEVINRLGKKQEQLTAFLAGQAEKEETSDF